MLLALTAPSAIPSLHCLQEVEVCPQEPHLFWSAGEDGMVRQYDTRLADQKAYGSPNVLINLATAGPRAGLVECKGLDVNVANPNMMAVACGDPYVRVFDRRRVGTGAHAAARFGRSALCLYTYKRTRQPQCAH